MNKKNSNIVRVTWSRAVVILLDIMKGEENNWELSSELLEGLYAEFQSFSWMDKKFHINGFNVFEEFSYYGVERMVDVYLKHTGSIPHDLLAVCLVNLSEGGCAEFPVSLLQKLKDLAKAEGAVGVNSMDEQFVIFNNIGPCAEVYNISKRTYKKSLENEIKI